MTVYELIQKLAKYDPDLKVEPWQESSRKKRRICSVDHPTLITRQGRRISEPAPVLIRIGWED